MTLKEAISILKQYIDYDNPDVPDFYTMEEACEVVIKAVLDLIEDYDLSMGQVVKGIHALPSVTPQQKPNIKALGEDMRICQKSITDKKVLIGFNMAVAICNKHLAEREVQNENCD